MIDVSAQYIASDPQWSCWVAASAGSGKTKVLIDRLTRLLLSGSAFDAIVCITYTNAAADEVRARLQRTLLEFAESPENCRGKLRLLLGREATADEQKRAHNLYSEFNKDTKAIKIQTIHSFCKELLTALPFEAGVWGPIRVIEETEAQHLLQTIQDNLLQDETNAVFFEALGTLSRFLSFQQIDDRIASITAKRYEFAEFLKNFPGDALAEYPHYLEEKLLTPTPARFHAEEAQALAHQLEPYATNVKDRAFLHPIQVGQFMDAFLTKTGTLRKTLCSQVLCAAVPDLCHALKDQAQAFYDSYMEAKTRDFITQTSAFVQVAQQIFLAYQNAKAEAEQYDFEDLIIKAYTLLLQAKENRTLRDAIFEQFPIRHLLIDEAQDTSPQQWQIISQLINLFFAPAQDNTLFVVGDIKQSIYSFQGARPWLFFTLEKTFQKYMEDLGYQWRTVKLQMSFRTTQTILDTVDKVFTSDDTGVSFDHSYAPHTSARKDEGFVQVLPVTKNADDDKKAYLENIAATVTQYIASLLHQNVLLPSTRAIVRPEDFLILTRRRSDLILEITKRLQAEGIAVSPPDKILLTNHLAWWDLLAFLRFLVFPQDDYNLACLLKSPFLSPPLSEEELLACCAERTSALWDRIRQKEHPLFSRFENSIVLYYQESLKLRTRSDFYHFFYRVFAHITPAFEQAYGSLATDIFSVFLEKLCACFDNAPPSLCHFLDYLERQEPTIRCPPQDGVRFMTIHGSKGLQAPIVILIDTGEPVSLQKETFAWLQHDTFSTDFLLLPPATLTIEPMQNIRQQVLQGLIEEDRRLLYVALTRAQDGLCCVGMDKTDSWLGKVAAVVEQNFVGSYQMGECAHASETSPPPLTETPTIIPFVTKKPAHFPQPAEPNLESERGILIHDFITELACRAFDRTEAEAWFRQTATDRGYPCEIETNIPLDGLLALPRHQLFHYIQNARHEAIFHQNEKLFRLDHLYIDEKEAVIIEVKTSPIVPAQLADIPAMYREQIQNYYELVRASFPKQRVRSYFLWTETASFQLFHGSEDV